MPSDREKMNYLKTKKCKKCGKIGKVKFHGFLTKWRKYACDNCNWFYTEKR